MEHLTISLPEPWRRYVERRVEEGCFETAADYVRNLIERDCRGAERGRIEALAIEGLESGEPVVMDDPWWAAVHAEFDERYGKAE